MHEDYIKKPDMEEICELEKCLVDALKAELPVAINSQNVSPACVDLYGKVVDMVKDFAETKKYCMEAYYYEHVVKAMKEAEHGMARYDYDEDDPMGYDPYRYASGRFAPKGRGKYRGYMPPYMLDDRMLPPDMNYMDENMHMAYPMDGHGVKEGSQTSKHGKGSGKYGYTYDEYQMAKSSGDKPMMESKAVEHVDGMLSTVRDLWKDSDPALKKRLKSEMTAFVNNEMTI